MRDRLIKSILILIGLFLVQHNSFAQKKFYQPFTELDSFYVDADYLLQRTSSHTADTVRAGILSLWDSGSSLSSENKEVIRRTSHKMLQKGLKVNKDLENYFACIVSEKLSNEQRNRFIQIADSSVNFYPIKHSKTLFSKTRLFLEKGLLYNHPYNSLIVEGGTFEFKHTPNNEYILGQQLTSNTSEKSEEKEEWFDHLKEEKAEEEETDTTQETDLAQESIDEEDPWAMLEDDSDISSNETEEEDPWASFLEDDTQEETSESSGDWSGYSSDWGEEWSGDETAVEEYTAPEQVIDSDYETLLQGLIYSNEEDISHYIPEEPPLPDVLGSFLYLRNANLTMASKYDTTILADITGSFMFHNDTLVGNGGRFTWANAGLSKDSVYCELPHYVLNVKTPALEGHHAEFHYVGYLDTLAIGYFEYFAHPLNDTPDKTTYPRFKTYTNDIEIHPYDPTIKIVGGFSLEGNKMSSHSFANGTSKLQVSKQDSVLFSMKAQEAFTMKDSIISSAKGKVVLYQFDSDSILHTSAKLTYDTHKKIAFFRKTKGLEKIIPFKLSYYGFDVDADQIKWDLKTDSLSFETLYASDKNPASFQSEGFFKPELFRRLQGFSKQHPLLSAINYVEKNNKQVFYGNEFAKERGLNYEMAKGMLQLMHREGLVYYSERSDEAIITPKGYFYRDAYFRLNKIRDAEVDYDNLKIYSKVPNGKNALVDFADSAIVIKGVESFQVSDSLNVRVLPDSGEVRLYQNQRMSFGGTVIAGNIVVRGKKFDFDYDQFLINLSEVDSISFLENGEEDGEFQNHISETSGTLYISASNNKSGLVKMEDYPTFDSDAGGKVQFNHSSVRGGSYDERVQFVMDSLSFEGNSDVKDKKFAGTFQSDGIFPDFDEDLMLNPDDHSYGFHRDTPAEGYEVYQGKGTFKGAIIMDAQGLQGKGNIEYLGSTFSSEDFLFFSDSMLTKGTSAIIESAIHPKVEMENYQMKWLVADDSMVFDTEKGKPFSMYNNQLYFRGSLALVPENISGEGEIETDEFYLGSEMFRFNKDDYVATDALFEIKSNDPNLPAMRGSHVRVENNMVTKSSVIYADESSNGKLSFPFTYYETDINKADWDQVNHKLYMATDAGRKAEFLSVFQGQDSLYFEGEKAEYDLQEHALTVSEISNIIVDQTEIRPSNSTVTIRKNAVIDEIQDATILMNIDHKYHEFYGAKVNIFSKKYFEATAKYDYTYVPYQKSTLFLNRLKIVEADTALEARAYGEIEETNAFEFLPGVMFSGNVKLSEDHPYMFFKGKAQLHLDRPNNAWFTYICQEGDTINPIIVNDALVDVSYGKPLQTGIWINDKKELVVPFLEFENALTEIDPIFTVTGELHYNHEEKTYEVKPIEEFPTEIVEKEVEPISEDEAIIEEETPTLTVNETSELLGKYQEGQYIEYATQKEEITFNGFVNLIPTSEAKKKESGVNLQTIASGKHYYAEDSLSFRMLMSLTMDLDRKIVNEMVKDFGSQTDVDITSLIEHPFDYHQNLRQLTDPEDFLALTTNEAKLYELLTQEILISEAKMIWSAEFQSFHNIGEVVLDGVFSNPIQQKIVAFIEMPKRERRDIAHIFLKSYKGNWYYFEIIGDHISMYSTNTYVRELIKSNKKGKINLAELDKVSAFINNFQTLYMEDEGDVEMITVEDVPTIDNIGNETEDALDGLPEDSEEEVDGF